MDWLELQTLWPFPADTVRERCTQAKSVVVVEMNMGQILLEVRKALDDPEKCSWPTESTAPSSAPRTFATFCASSRAKESDPWLPKSICAKIYASHLVPRMRARHHHEQSGAGH